MGLSHSFSFTGGQEERWEVEHAVMFYDRAWELAGRMQIVKAARTRV